MTEPATPTPRRWLKPVLFVSLALNLAFVGLIGGTAYRLKEGGGPPVGLSAFGSPYVRAMKDHDRRVVFQAARPEPGHRVNLGTARQAQFAQMMALLRAPTFDAGAAGAVLKAQADHALQFQKDVQAAWLARLNEMSQAERAQYADRLQDRLDRRARWHDKHKRRDRD